jgi:hypothetical protein
MNLRQPMKGTGSCGTARTGQGSVHFAPDVQKDATAAANKAPQET